MQDNHSHSARGTLRGLHYQWRRPQGKLLRVIDGEIFDVAVDIREASPTLWPVGRRRPCRPSNFLQFYVPPGFAHGFCVTSETAQVEYKCTDLYDPEGEGGIAWDDPELAIGWPTSEVILSDRDRGHPTLRGRYGRGPTGPGVVCAALPVTRP